MLVFSSYSLVVVLIILLVYRLFLKSKLQHFGSAAQIGTSNDPADPQNLENNPDVTIS